jgi:signal transduction histidine kinase
MIIKLSLKTQIYLIITILMITISVCAIVIMIYTQRLESLITSIIKEDLVAFKVAESMEVALVNHKGFVTYYFLDKNPDWLRKIGEYRQEFKERLQDARKINNTSAQKKILDLIEVNYKKYIVQKDQIIQLYNQGEIEQGRELHKFVRRWFFQIIDYCESYKNSFSEQIKQSSVKSYKQANRLRGFVILGLVVTVLMGFSIVFILITKIWNPLKKLTKQIHSSPDPNSDKQDEVESFQHDVQGLIYNVGEKEKELEQNREHLIQKEKLALVGKLASGMAHSVRNPLTSVKMRLFSLGRTIEFDQSQREDFDVIGEEIQHVDNIVQNFLEFSRPPRLKTQKISPSEIVDQTLEILEQRLQHYEVVVSVKRGLILPEIKVDPEQFREALVNLIINACEAIGKGGKININEVIDIGKNNIKQSIIGICDNGSGIPSEVRSAIFKPFFTTKDEGTGLGLSIVARIIEGHNGTICVRENKPTGTCFIITLPVDGDTNE